MTLLRCSAHPRGLSLHVKEQVYMKRKRDKKPWTVIASEVKNLQGGRPYWTVVRKAYWDLVSGTKHRAKKFNYQNCGRKAVLTKDLIKWLINKMLALHLKSECTSGDLQRILVKEKGAAVDESTIRHALNDEGYYYLARDKKPRYGKEECQVRVDFSRPFAKCSAHGQKEKVQFCMDGVVLTRPPPGLVARENYIHTNMPKVWRRRDEAGLPEPAGFDRYQKQVPPSRMIPLWGGVGPGGFAPVLWHDDRKTDNVEWSAVVRS